MFRFVFALAALIAFSDVAGASGLFDYDAAKPVQPAYGSSVQIGPGITSRSVRFQSPSGNEVTGEIISGSAKKAHAAVLFVHWLGDPKTTNHTQFEADAKALAARGVTSLLVDAMWANPKWIAAVGASADADIKATTAQVIDLRRALDVLIAEPGVDATRVAFVGHDFGAMMGALLSSVDTRPRCYVFVAGNSSLAEWYQFGAKTKDAAYAAQLAPFDILAAVGQAKAQGFLFQFSAKDKYIPEANAMAFFNAAPLPRGAFFYDIDHSLDTPKAFADRQAWLKLQLLGE